MAADRELLFGILALQNDCVSREDLIAGVQVWLQDKSPSLADLLIRRGAIGADECDLVQRLTELHLKKHDGDPRKSLATISSLGAVKDELQRLGDADIDATLSRIPSGFTGPSKSFVMSPEFEEPRQSMARSSRFRVLRLHARGGLGEVFVARDEELNRDVALKEIQPRYVDDPNSRGRFMMEAEVTGGLEHPGIVPVYGLGQYEDGRPYYAMRFIKGDSLKEAIAAFHSVSGPVTPAFGDAGQALQDKPMGSEPENRVGTGNPGTSKNSTAILSASSFASLEFRKLLGRFIDVCHAISYAHSRGVLHRDLKPGNIMLGKYGETLVVDWGLAKVNDRDDSVKDTDENTLGPVSGSGVTPTIIGNAIGTPAYMPPEQAAGRLDELGPASDVYSLGATLYHLLAGVPPFRGRDVLQILKDVQSGTFRPPSEIQPQLPRALEAVCLKAMQLKISGRYPAANSLAEEIERFLADKPVTAFAEPFSVKARRWVRNHQTLVTAVSAVVLVSVAGLAIFSSIVSGKNIELTRVNNSLDESNVQLTQSNNRERDAREQAEQNEQAAHQQSQLALSTLNAIVKDIQIGIRTMPGSSTIRRRLLATALNRFESVSTEYVAQARVDLDTQIAIREMADVVIQFGPQGPADENGSLSETEATAIELATKLYNRAHEIGAKLVAANPRDSQAQGELANTLIQLGMTVQQTGRLQEALDLFRQSLQISERLVADYPDQEPWRVAESSSRIQVGDVLAETGALQEALASYSQAHAARELLLVSHPDSLVARQRFCESLARLGLVSYRLGDLGKSLDFYVRQVSERQMIADAEPENDEAQRALALALGALGDTRQRMGKLPEALALYRQVHDIHKTRAANDESDSVARHDLSVILQSMGEVHLQTNSPDQALACYDESAQISRKLTDADPADTMARRDLIVAIGNLGDLCMQSGNVPGAIGHFSEAMEFSEKILAVDSTNVQARRDLSTAVERMGMVHEFQGQLEKSREFYLRMLTVKREIAAFDETFLAARREVGVALSHLGDVCHAMGDPKAAIGYYDKALVIDRQNLASDPLSAESHRDLIVSLATIGEIRMKMPDFDAAETAFNEAVSILHTMLEQKIDVETAEVVLAQIQARAAVARMTKLAVSEWADVLKLDATGLPGLLVVRGREFVRQGRVEEAVQAATKLCEIETVDSGKLFEAACVFSLCAASIRPSGDENLTDEQTAQRQAWIAAALASLKRSIDAGWNDFVRLQQDSDLAILQELPEFKALLPKL